VSYGYNVSSKKMKNSKITILFLCLMIHHCFAEQYPTEAVTVVPIADLVGQALGNAKYYNSIALCAKDGAYGCPRIHQLLLHERVTILEECGEEVKIKIPQVFYETDSEDHCAIYWSLKKNFVSLHSLTSKNVDISKLPPGIDYAHKQEHNNRIVTLCFPYYVNSLRITLSAGTRFLRTQESEKKDSISVYVLNPHTKKIQTLLLPIKLCCTEIPSSYAKKRALFLKLLNEWAHQKDGFIAYVWGGCSFATPCTYEPFSIHKGLSYKGKSVSYYVRSELRSAPVNGFDCTGLIVRAAHIAGIPFYYKNSTTIARYLKTLENHTIEEGDLIWFPGHVIVIANKEKNSIIEARAYAHGYGKVHELPLNKVFKDINTFDDLLRAYAYQEPLQRLMSDGSVAQTISTFKILKLSSIWENKKGHDN
jgi:ASC-1-like (ASCH) protein